MATSYSSTSVNTTYLWAMRPKQGWVNRFRSWLAHKIEPPFVLVSTF